MGDRIHTGEILDVAKKQGSKCLSMVQSPVGDGVVIKEKGMEKAGLV